MRKFVEPSDLTDLVHTHVGSDRRLVRLERLAGGSKKGVYRLAFDDESTLVLYVWHADENFWPDAPAHEPDDPFTDASGVELFEAAYHRLIALDIGTPTVHVVDRGHTVYPADIALLDDVRGGQLADLLERDHSAAERTLIMLRDSLDRMSADRSPRFGKLDRVMSGARNGRRPEAVMLGRAAGDLDEAASYLPVIAADRDRIETLLGDLATTITPRDDYGLVHGELGPDHVMLTTDGRPLLIDIEGLAYFDIEWEHVFLRMRFGRAYAALQLPDLDPARLRFYQLVHHLSLVAGPLRIAAVPDFDDAAAMREIAEAHAARALAFR